MLIPKQLRQVREKLALTDRTHTHPVNMAQHTNTIAAWLCNLMKSSLNLTVLLLFCELETHGSQMHPKQQVELRRSSDCR